MNNRHFSFYFGTYPYQKIKTMALLHTELSENMRPGTSKLKEPEGREGGREGRGHKTLRSLDPQTLKELNTITF